MLKKNIDKQKRRERQTWVGYYTRITPTKKQKQDKLLKKEKQKLRSDYGGAFNLCKVCR